MKLSISSQECERSALSRPSARPLFRDLADHAAWIASGKHVRGNVSRQSIGQEIRGPLDRTEIIAPAGVEGGCFADLLKANAGENVAPAMLRLALRAVGHPMLVTDAMPPVGGSRSSFTLYGQEITARGGRCTTRDGTLVDLWDAEGIQHDDANTWAFEGEWGAGGATCVSRTRWANLAAASETVETYIHDHCASRWKPGACGGVDSAFATSQGFTVPLDTRPLLRSRITNPSD